MRKISKSWAVLGLAMLAMPSVRADDDLYTYDITVINRVGETVSVICNGSNPRPLGQGASWRFPIQGPDGFAIECTGYDHHGEAIASVGDTLDHHHLAHTLVLQRGHH